MYDGEVFTYRTDRMTRPPARSQRTPGPDTGRAEAPAGSERMARLETTVQRLEERLTHLTGVVEQLSAALDVAESARTMAKQKTPVPRAPSAPKVSVQFIKEESPAAPPPSDVKVSLFAGNSTEAILGQVRVIPQS